MTETDALEIAKRKRIRKQEKIVIFLVSSLIICCLAFVAYLFWENWYFRTIQEDYFIADQTDPTDVAIAFAFSLPYNRIENMKQFVVEEKWDFLDVWSRTHSPISDACRFPSDPDIGSVMSFGGTGQGEDGSETGVGLFYTLECPDDPRYRVLVDVNLKSVDGKWFITDWDTLEIGR